MLNTFGLVARPWSTERRGVPPPLLFIEGGLTVHEKVLSCFIDESGDFGSYDHHSPYYIVAVVLHDQKNDISNHIKALDEHLSHYGYSHHALHTGPLIRRESDYEFELMEIRKHLFNVLYNFARRLPFQYLCIQVDKSECADEVQQISKISKALSKELKSHSDFFSSFDNIVVYYDNGQSELTKIISSVFNTLFSNVEIRKVKPADYKLFQVADLICTLELLSEKASSNSFTKSETEFLKSPRAFRKEYYKKIHTKHL